MLTVLEPKKAQSTFSYTPQDCYENLQDIHNIQVFLLSNSCPEELKNELLEHQMNLIDDLSTRLCMLKS